MILSFTCNKMLLVNLLVVKLLMIWFKKSIFASDDLIVFNYSIKVLFSCLTK